MTISNTHNPSSAVTFTFTKILMVSFFETVPCYLKLKPKKNIPSSLKLLHLTTAKSKPKEPSS